MFITFLMLITVYTVYVEPNAQKEYIIVDTLAPSHLPGSACYAGAAASAPENVKRRSIITLPGAFNLTITRFDFCKGPKQKDCASSTATITNSSTLSYNLTVFQNVSPTKGKIVATTNGKDILRLQVKKPCEHLFLRPLFSSLMNVTKDCFVIKGHYRFNVDVLGIAQSYFGGTFVFGNWTFKSLFYSDACNFSCANIQVVMSPKG